MRSGARPVGLALGLLLLATSGSVASDPDEAGRAAYGHGDYAAAERLFAAAIARSPQDATLRYHYAITLTQLGRWSEAEQQHEYALKLRPAPEIAMASRQALEQLRALARSAPLRSRPGIEEGTIALEAFGGGWVAPVMLNGRRQARFLVDTGASVSVISPELATSLGIQVTRDARSVRLHTPVGQTSAPLVAIPLLRLGTFEARDTPAVILDIDMGIDGILGNTFLARYTITLDARKGLLQVRGR